MIVNLDKEHCELKRLLAGDARRHLRCFKGAKLAVFLSLLLHSNEERWADTAISQLERETGYRKQTIENAVRGLCRLELNGRRVMLIVSERKEIGYAARKHYLLFPTESDIARYEKAQEYVFVDEFPASNKFNLNAKKLCNFVPS